MANAKVRVRAIHGTAPTAADRDSVKPRGGKLRQQEKATNVGTGGPKTPAPRGGQNVETMSIKTPPKKGGR